MNTQVIKLNVKALALVVKNAVAFGAAVVVTAPLMVLHYVGCGVEWVGTKIADITARQATAILEAGDSMCGKDHYRVLHIEQEIKTIKAQDTLDKAKDRVSAAEVEANTALAILAIAEQEARALGIKVED